MSWGEGEWGQEGWGDGEFEDVSPPVVADFVPAINSAIQPSATLAFSVTDDSGMVSSVTVEAAFPSGVLEQVFDGATFVGSYAAGSQRSSIADGYGFTIARDGGWPEAPTLRIAAADPTGNDTLKIAPFRPASYIDRPATIAIDDRQGVGSSLPKGILAPFRRDLKNDFAHGSGTTVIANNIREILLAQAAEEDAAGDVAWDGTLGSRLHLIVHRAGTPGLDEIARHFVVDAVRRQEPRARITRVRLSRKKNVTTIGIKFVPTDRNGRAIGAEDNVDVPIAE